MNTMWFSLVFQKVKRWLMMLFSLLRRRGEEASMGKKTPTITITPMVVTYNGQAISAPTVTTDSDGMVTYTYYKDGVALQGAPVDAGSYTVVVETSETANYLAGSATGSITINRFSVILSWSNLAPQYTGSVLSPSANIASTTYDQISVSVSVAGEPINVGTYACTATLTGAKADNYEIASGYETNTLTITKMQIVASLNAVTYDGTNKWPSNTDYVTYSGAGTAINAGTYQVTASLNDTANTEWSDHTTADKTLTLTINAANISSCTVTGIDASYDYTGSAITPSPTVTFGGATLVEYIDYTVSYGNNINTGTASVIITGTGNFTGTTEVTFAIVQSEPAVFTLADPDCGAKWIYMPSTNSYQIEQDHTSYINNRRVALGYIKSGKTIAELLQLFSNNSDRISVFNASGSIVTQANWSSTIITTGMKLELRDSSSSLLDRIYLVVFGDLDDDGLINNTDRTQLYRYIRNQVSLANEQLVAADINHDGAVSVSDYQYWTTMVGDQSAYEQDFA